MSKLKKKTSKPQRAKKLQGEVKNGFFSRNKYIILSFAVPFVLMTVAFAVADVAPFGIFSTMYQSIAYQIGKLFPDLGITVVPNLANPWGDKQMLVIDLWHQYYPFLYDLHEKLQSGGSLFWTWSVGMGTNFIAMASYYLLSPLNFLSVFIPDSVMVQYLAVATVIKLSCAGMFTAICFRIMFKKNDLSLVIFSVLFALCSFNMGYYWCVIWMDSVAMLPLVVAGTVSLLRDGKFKLFTISLALAVIFNYYIGLFICIAVFLTAVGYTCSRWHSLRKSLKDLLRTLICSVSALMMTAPVTVPAFLALQNCYKSVSGFPKRFDINIGTDDAEGVFNAIHQIFSNLISFITPTDKEGLPNVACGVLCLVLLAVFLCSKKIKLGEKLFCSVSLLFFVASFIFRQLDYIWHGFHFPNMLPYRFSFLMSFLLIYMAYRAFTVINHCTFIDIIIGALVFALIMLSYFLRPADIYTPAAAYASIAVGGAMIIVLLLYTFKVLPYKAMSALLCLIVIGEMCATGIIGVDTVSTTTTSGYPKESANVNRVVSHIDAWAEESQPDIFRTEVTSTQTLNDGALNQYNGISMFNSMANASITKYTEYLGCAGWPAGNRYTYYESSPVTNLILNLKYLIARDGTVRNTMYMQEADSSGNVVLYENSAYIPMGFMTSSALESFDVNVTSGNPGTVDNPFENQIEWFRLATGIEEPVYTQLSVKDQGHTSSDILTVNKTSEGHYSASPLDRSASIHTKFNYYLEEDGLVCVYYKVSNNSGDGNVYVNDQNHMSIGVKTSSIRCVGEQKAGDKISLYANIETGKSSTIRAYCYVLNKDVFDRGVEILRESVLQATKATDTVLEGTINVKEDGLLYTSIPYEAGWSAKVDGKSAEIIAVGDGVCAVKLSAGEHKVKFSYIPDGFVIGVAAFCIGLAMLLFFTVMTMKKSPVKSGAVKSGICRLFDPNVKEKAKDEEEETTEELPEEPKGSDTEDALSEKAPAENTFAEEDTSKPEAGPDSKE